MDNVKDSYTILSIHEKDTQIKLTELLNHAHINYSKIQHKGYVDFKFDDADTKDHVCLNYLNNLPYMKVEDIQNKYKDNYVYLADIRYNENKDVLGGYILAYGETPKELYSKLNTIEYNQGLIECYNTLDGDTDIYIGGNTIV